MCYIQPQKTHPISLHLIKASLVELLLYSLAHRIQGEVRDAKCQQDFRKLQSDQLLGEKAQDYKKCTFSKSDGSVRMIFPFPQNKAHNVR